MTPDRYLTDDERRFAHGVIAVLELNIERIAARGTRVALRRYLGRLMIAVVLLNAITIFAVGYIERHSVGADVVRRIQAERRDGIKRACLAQNTRNSAAVAFISSLPGGHDSPHLSPAEKAKLIQGLADALVGPITKDCDAAAARATGRG